MPKKHEKKVSKSSRKPKSAAKKKPVKKSVKSAIPQRAPVKTSPESKPTALVETKTLIISGSSTMIPGPAETRSVFDLGLANIDGDTTIGDLLVVFPRTRDIFLKHGVSFEVEEAGYVYMTLSVFSAMHGVKINSLLEELITASKEIPVTTIQSVSAHQRPLQSQAGRQVTVSTTTA